MKRWTWLMSICLTLGLIAQAGGEGPSGASVVRLQNVSVESSGESVQVTLKTSGAPAYTHMMIDNPPRLVIDLRNGQYGWRKEPLTVGNGPLRQVRGSQFRNDIARLVLEFDRPAPYQIRESAEGLVILIGLTEPLASQPSSGTPPPLAAAPPEEGSSPATPATTAQETRAVAEAPSEATAGRPGQLPPRREEAPIVAAKNLESPSTESAPPTIEAKPKSAGPPVIVAQAKEPAARKPRTAQTQGAPARARTAQQAAPTTPPAQAEGGRLISLDFKDADIQNILRILAAESGKNVVAGEDVKGKITISLKNVPWELALDTVLESHGLQKIEKDNVLRVVTTERVIKEQEAKAKADDAKIKAETEGRTKKAEAELKEAEAMTKKQAAIVAVEEAKARGPLKEETIRLAYADAEETTKTLLGILGLSESGAAPQAAYGPPGGLGATPPFSSLFGPPGAPQPAPLPAPEVLAKGITIRAHKPTNSIFIRHYEADIERIKKLVKEKIDIQLPQVQIEARMEIVRRRALEALGIQWGGAFAQDTGNGKSTLLGAGGATTPAGTTGVSGVNIANPNLTLTSALPVLAATGLPSGGNLINLPISSLAGPLGGPAAGLIFGLVGNRFNINLALQALEFQGKTRTLAQPQIVTVENAKATMSLGEEIPYATVSSAGTQIQFKEALLKLEVTPSVILENGVTKIKMKVMVENNARGAVVDLGSAGNPPAIDKRKAETEVLVKEGERLVIGGVINETDISNTRKVPFLGNIPVLGWLFKDRTVDDDSTELIVIITPTVLKSRGQ